MEVKQKVRFSLGRHESSDKVRVSPFLFLIMANKREFGVVTLYCQTAVSDTVSPFGYCGNLCHNRSVRGITRVRKLGSIRNLKATHHLLICTVTFLCARVTSPNHYCVGKIRVTLTSRRRIHPVVVLRMFGLEHHPHCPSS